MKKLTIGSAVYDDFDGVYFSYQSLRLNNQDIWDDLDLLIIDNNPDSAQGKATKAFCEKAKHIRYIPYQEKTSTAIRNQIFKHAQGEFCMSIDCHVLFEPGTVKRLIKHFEDNPETQDLFHGPMLYDVIDGHDPTTHMEPVWRDHMFGIWGYNKQGTDPENPPFEIPMHGLGIFACKTSAWLGFNENFSGFGGEEGYIHKKFEQAGRKTWCLPFLRWLHRFDRPTGVKYPLSIEDRIKNYFIGHTELGLPYDDIFEHFGKKAPHVNLENLLKQTQEKKEETPEGNSKTIAPYDPVIKFWGDSKIDFAASDPFRYIKYEIYDSYDGHASIDRVVWEPMSEKATIKFCSSEDPKYPSENLLNNQGAWRSNQESKGSFPHVFIIDLNEKIRFKSITSFTKPGDHFGMPKKFNVFISIDEKEWTEVSSVDVEKV